MEWTVEYEDLNCIGFEFETARQALTDAIEQWMPFLALSQSRDNKLKPETRLADNLSNRRPKERRGQMHTIAHNHYCPGCGSGWDCLGPCATKAETEDTDRVCSECSDMFMADIWRKEAKPELKPLD